LAHTAARRGPASWQPGERLAAARRAGLALASPGVMLLLVLFLAWLLAVVLFLRRLRSDLEAPR